MRIGDICTRDVIQCSRTTTALELARIMHGSHAVGIATDRVAVEVMDLLNLIGSELTLLGRVMSRERFQEDQARR
jgi:hypothetical protein